MTDMHEFERQVWEAWQEAEYNAQDPSPARLEYDAFLDEIYFRDDLQ